MTIKRADLLLKIIAAAEGEPLTPAQLQKVAFLVAKKFPDDVPANYYRFQKYDYGPFCVDIYRDAESLERDGLVLITINQGGGWQEYSASYQAGAYEFDAISDRISRYIKETVTWARSISFQELVRSIFIDYPEYRENSVFQS